MRLRALFEPTRGENGTGRWLLSLADHSMGTLAALYSLSLSHTRAHTHFLSHEHSWAQTGWLCPNYLLCRTGAVRSSVVMYGVWLLLATSPHSHKFNTSSYGARSGSKSSANCCECVECLSAGLSQIAQNDQRFELKENQFYKCQRYAGFLHFYMLISGFPEQVFDLVCTRGGGGKLRFTQESRFSLCKIQNRFTNPKNQFLMAFFQSEYMT